MKVRSFLFLAAVWYVCSFSEANLQAQTLLCDPNSNCSPDPNQTQNPSYAGTLAARPMKQNARGTQNPLIAAVAGPLKVPVLVGSQSYNRIIPILSLPGRGLDLNLNLYYNSRIWTLDTVNNTITLNADRDFPSYGFRLDFGYLESDGSGVQMILTEKDGTKHALLLTGSVPNGFLYDSNDGTFIEYNSATSVLTYKNGTMVKYQPFPSAATLFRPVQIMDTNRNYISIAYVTGSGNDQHIDTITDTLDRQIKFVYDTSGQLQKIAQLNVSPSTPGADASGTRVWATFSWAPVTLTHNFSGVTVVSSTASNSAFNALTGCTYPNQTGYKFSYGDWGIVNRIDQLSAPNPPGPSNPRAIRSYEAYNFPNTAQSLNDAPRYTTMTVSPDGTSTSIWTYSVQQSAPGQIISQAVTDQLGTITTVTVNSDGTPASTQIKDNTGKIFRTLRYSWIAVGSNTMIGSVVTADDAGNQSSVSYSYDSFGNVIDKQEFGFGSALLRETVASYKGAPFTTSHILNLPASVLVKDPSGVVRGRTDFGYDEVALLPLSPFPFQNDSVTSTHRGNVTTVASYSDAATPGGRTYRRFTYDQAGNMALTQPNCCDLGGAQVPNLNAQTKFNFDPATQYAYLSSIVRGQFTTSYVYSVDNGLLQTVTDENNQPTSYLYDNMYRVIKVTQPPSSGQEVSQTITYGDDAALPTVTATTTANSSEAVQTFDCLGHLTRQDTIDSSSGLTVSSTGFLYDPIWRRKASSNPYGPGETVLWNNVGYDALNRVTSVTPPSGGGSSFSFAGNTVTVKDPAGKQRKNYFDALGRLVQVDEPGESFNGAKASGSFTFTPALQSTFVVTHAATNAIGSVTIGGGELQTTDFNNCTFDVNGFQTCAIIYDTGAVTVTVNGQSYGTVYGQGDDINSVANRVAQAIRAGSPYVDYSSIVPFSNTSGSFVTINLIARNPGSAGNYPLACSVASNDPLDFGRSGGFTNSCSGPALTGGTDQTGNTIYDSGTVSLSVGGYSATANYGNGTGQDSTASALTLDLAAKIQAQLPAANPPFSISGASATISINWNAVGNAGNVPVSTTSTTTSGHFSTPSFATCSVSVNPQTCSGALAGGKDPYPSGLANPFSTTYTYDVGNNLTSVSQAAGLVNNQLVSGQPRSYTYDDLGRLTSSTTPESGTVNNYYTDSTSAACAWDPSLVCRAVDARGVTKNVSYDGTNRLSSVVYTNDPANTAQLTYQYDALGRLTKITDGVNSQTFTYDNRGRVISAGQTIDGVPYPLSYAYNAADQVTSITYPSNRLVSQNYDALGRLYSIASGGTTYLTINTFNSAMQPTAVTYGNQVEGAFHYNDHLQIDALRYYQTGAASDILTLRYDYSTGVPGNNGQIQAMHYFNAPGAEDPTKSESFTYDAWSRLSQAQTLNLTASNTWSLQWSYDRLGNRLTQKLTGGNLLIGQPTFAVDPSTNHIIGFCYDAAGNLLDQGACPAGGHLYTYDGANRLTAINGTVAQYTYLGPLRIKKVVGPTTMIAIYSGNKPIAEYAPGAALASPLAEYLYNGSSLLATLAGGVATYHHPDHLSNRAETNSSGTPVRTYGHFPFGETWYETGTADKWKFTGYEHDSESSLDYASFRYYGNFQGRFSSPDPLEGNPSLPQSLNRYAYVSNDPINLIDPMGLSIFDPNFNCLQDELGNCLVRVDLGGGCNEMNPCDPASGITVSIDGPGFGGGLGGIPLPGCLLPGACPITLPKPNVGDLLPQLPAPCRSDLVITENCNSAQTFSGAAAAPVIGLCAAQPEICATAALIVVGVAAIVALPTPTLCTFGDCPALTFFSKHGKQNVAHDYVRAMASQMPGDYCSSLKKIMDDARNAGNSKLFNDAKATWKQDCR